MLCAALYNRIHIYSNREARVSRRRQKNFGAEKKKAFCHRPSTNEYRTLHSLLGRHCSRFPCPPRNCGLSMFGCSRLSCDPSVSISFIHSVDKGVFIAFRRDSFFYAIFVGHGRLLLKRKGPPRGSLASIHRRCYSSMDE